MTQTTFYWQPTWDLKKSPPLKFDLEKVKDETLLEEYNVETSNRFSELFTNWRANESAPDEVWNDTKSAFLDIAEKKLGKKKKLRPVKPYISEEAYQLAEEK